MSDRDTSLPEPSESAADPAIAPRADGSPTVRLLLWTVLGLALVAAVVAGLWGKLGGEPPEPLPVLAEAPEFTLTDQTGAPFSSAELAGEPYVLDFVFTRCVAACPVMTRRLSEVEPEGPDGAVRFRRVSVSVDPEHDTPEVLAEYAASRGLDRSWVFLTGEPDTILRLSREGFLLALDPDTGNPDDPIAHSTRYVLVDGRGQIRGFYDALRIEEVEQLETDLGRLLEEDAA